MQPFSCILLAGGMSSRMGRDKALLPISPARACADEHVLLQHMAKIAQLSGAEQIVVSRDPKLQLPTQTQFLFVADQYPQLGPLAGLHACLPFCDYDRVLVLPVDMPALSVELLSSLVSSPNPAYFEGYEMPCLLYRNAALEAFLAEQLVNPNARRSIRSLINWTAAEALPLPSSVDERALLNTNTPEQWQRFLQGYSGPIGEQQASLQQGETRGNRS
ncbi:MAG: molybdenum cofactor guanylyltransferase [Aliidiomarina sp.]|uniref:molybdenum cofactor guanylyltransferase n=1 Tax=Aliidiomarina sp. TaxID=1872439 RepID=UPI0025B965CD|nr:molybdenum cofactor guanylyltransferase [Aliidiomarina sp.]MCH8501094.1 molybdenum cofactor guanylyltransferase [Aliidiomarina sp.]